ncbi:MAG: MFS transporter [Clostridia bacterium]|nr:MFS transporter [Clostridia bacterium]
MSKNHDGNKNSVVNFGAHGWVTILYCLLMFWFYVGMCNDGSNITAPAAAAKLGVANGVILNMNSIAGLVGVLFFIVLGQVNRKIGARITSGILVILAGVAYIGVGNATSVVMYTVCMCFVVGAIMSAGYIAGGSLVAQWFPKKKGVVMGYTTMGHNLASAFYVPLITFLVAKLGITGGVYPIAIAAIVLGVLGLLFIRNTPQERGLNPDNVSDEVYKAEYDTNDEGEDGGWTTAKLLKNKELWLAAITTGFFQICSVGVMTQLVVRNMELGFEQNTAIAIMTVLACVGVIGSWLIGIFDDKFGTKRTMIGFGIWYMVALLCNFTNSMPLVYLSLFMIAIGIGGSANFTTSLPASIFGRHGFAKVNSVIFPIQGAVTALCFAVNGVVQLLTGGEVRMAYLVFAGVALINVVLVLFIKDRKYNRDFQAEQHRTH